MVKKDAHTRVDGGCARSPYDAQRLRIAPPRLERLVSSEAVGASSHGAGEKKEDLGGCVGQKRSLAFRTIDASLQPILSAINRAHRDAGLAEPAEEFHFLTAARSAGHGQSTGGHQYA